MTNIWTTLILVIVCTVGGYYLAQYWAPFGYIGFLAAFILIGMYVFSRNQRIQ